MTQPEVFELLKTKKKAWYSSTAIGKMLDRKSSSITTSLKRLRKFKLIEFRLIKGKRKEYEYKYKKLDEFRKLY